jgi:hypothetical protein
MRSKKGTVLAYRTKQCVPGPAAVLRQVFASATDYGKVLVMQKRYRTYMPVLLTLAFVCFVALGSITLSHGADENKDKSTSKKSFEVMKRDLKKVAENIEKIISDGASAVAEKVKKTFSSKERGRN